MSNGGYKGQSPARETSPEQYPGVWELTEQFQAQADGNWPFQETDNAPKSLRFNSSDSAHLSKTPALAGNRKTWTWSGWVKRSAISEYQIPIAAGVVGSTPRTYLRFDTADTLRLQNDSGFFYLTNAVFKDPSAWMHLVWAVDTTNATAADRVKLYVNGTQVTSFSSVTTAALNEDTLFNSTSHTAYIGRENRSLYYLNGYLADIHFIDGQALSCEEFGFFDGQGIWQPKRFTGDYASGPVYSNFGDTTYIQSSYPWTKAFDGIADGSYSNGAGAVDPGDWARWTPPNGIPVSQALRINTDNGTTSAVKVKFIGQPVQHLTSLSDGWNSVSGTGTLEYIEIYNSGSTWSYLCGVEIDGQILIDASVGRNSFHLDFSDTSSNTALGKDSSGVGNDWTPNNLSHFTGVDPTVPANTYQDNTLGYYLNGNPPLFLTKQPTGTNRADQITHGSNTGTTFAVNDVLQWAIDWTGGTAKMWFGRNNTWYSGDPAAGTNPSVSGVSDMNLFLSLAYNSSDFQLQVPATASYTLPTGYSYWGGVTLGTWKTSGTNQGATPDVFTTPIPRTGKVYIEAIIKGGTSTYACIGLQNNGETSVISDVSVDTPVNGTEVATTAGGERRGNYCTWSPVNSKNHTLSNGNLDCSLSIGTTSQARATIGVTSGKYYWEVKFISGNYGMIGISDASISTSNVSYAAGGLNMYVQTGGLYGDLGGSFSNTSYGSALSANDIIGVALDMDNGNVKFYKNGTDLGVANTSTLVGKTIMPHIAEAGGDSFVTQTNFGARSWTYAAPSGYSPIATCFLPEPAIKRGDEAMTAVIFTGNDTLQRVSGIKFSPDLVWVKQMSGGASHELFDSVRGKGTYGYKTLYTNQTFAEYTSTAISNSGVTDLHSDGFSVGGSNNVNDNNQTYVAWAFDAGETTTTFAADSLTSSLYNQDQVWSNFLTSSNGFVPGYTADQAFNEVLNSGGGSATNGVGGVMTFAPTSALSVSTMDIRVYSDTTITFPDSSTVAVSGQGATYGWIPVTLPSSFTGFTGSNSITLHNTNNGLQYFDGLRINGKILVNSNISFSVPSIAANVRARPERGLSIVTYSGVDAPSRNTVSHGLNEAPVAWLIKNRSGTGNWTFTFNFLDGSNDYMFLNSTNAKANQGSPWDTPPTSSVITLGANDLNTCNAGDDFVMYAFAPVESYSKFGSYLGFGQKQTIHTGFAPAFLMIKAVDYTEKWYMYDIARQRLRGKSVLRADTDEAETSSGSRQVHLSSNGFTLFGSDTGINDTGISYIYMCFAEFPFASQARAR